MLERHLKVSSKSCLSWMRRSGSGWTAINDRFSTSVAAVPGRGGRTRVRLLYLVEEV